jgi:hypothetical protein
MTTTILLYEDVTADDMAGRIKFNLTKGAAWGN